MILNSKILKILKSIDLFLCFKTKLFCAIERSKSQSRGKDYWIDLLWKQKLFIYFSWVFRKRMNSKLWFKSKTSENGLKWMRCHRSGGNSCGDERNNWWQELSFLSGVSEEGFLFDSDSNSIVYIVYILGSV